jgi:hypothetical protein
MVIADIAYESIREWIAIHPAERGGALYGPRSYPFVTHFEYDPEAETSAVSYVPSRRLIINVQRVERETGLQFKGIVHSHPLGLTRPSGGDEQTVRSFFRLNPHLAQIALPIVQPLLPPTDEREEHRKFLHWYRAERAKLVTDDERQVSQPTRPRTMGSARVSLASDPHQGVSIVPEDVRVLPIRQHVQRIVGRLAKHGVHLEVDPVLQSLRLDSAELVGLVAREIVTAQESVATPAKELMFFVSLDYPIVAPVVLRAANGMTLQVQFLWDGTGDIDQSLDAVTDSFYGPLFN